MSKHSVLDPAVNPAVDSVTDSTAATITVWVAFTGLLDLSEDYTTQQEALDWLAERVTAEQWTQAVNQAGRHDTTTTRLPRDRQDADTATVLSCWYGPIVDDGDIIWVGGRDSGVWVLPIQRSAPTATV